MNVTCQDCNGTGYKPSTSKYGGDGLYRCYTCRTSGQIPLSLNQVREVLRQVSETYVSAERVT